MGFKSVYQSPHAQKNQEQMNQGSPVPEKAQASAGFVHDNAAPPRSYSPPPPQTSSSSRPPYDPKKQTSQAYNQTPRPPYQTQNQTQNQNQNQSQGYNPNYRANPAGSAQQAQQKGGFNVSQTPRPPFSPQGQSPTPLISRQPVYSPRNVNQPAPNTKPVGGGASGGPGFLNTSPGRPMDNPTNKKIAGSSVIDSLFSSINTTKAKPSPHKVQTKSFITAIDSDVSKISGTQTPPPSGPRRVNIDSFNFDSRLVDQLNQGPDPKSQRYGQSAQQINASAFDNIAQSITTDPVDLSSEVLGSAVSNPKSPSNKEKDRGWEQNHHKKHTQQLRQQQQQYQQYQQQRVVKDFYVMSGYTPKSLSSIFSVRTVDVLKSMIRDLSMSPTSSVEVLSEDVIPFFFFFLFFFPFSFLLFQSRRKKDTHTAQQTIETIKTAELLALNFGFNPVRREAPDLMVLDDVSDRDSWPRRPPVCPERKEKMHTLCLSTHSHCPF